MFIEDLGTLNILLVDDDPPFRDLAVLWLTAIGISKVTCAGSGVEAVSKISESPAVYDCVICDYVMAQGNGLQLLQAIRLGLVKRFRPDGCFILLTGSGKPQVVDVAGKLDVNRYLIKPVTLDKLRDGIVKARSKAIPLDMNKYRSVIVPDTTA